MNLPLLTPLVVLEIIQVKSNIPVYTNYTLALQCIHTLVGGRWLLVPPRVLHSRSLKRDSRGVSLAGAAVAPVNRTPVVTQHRSSSAGRDTGVGEKDGTRVGNIPNNFSKMVHPNNPCSSPRNCLLVYVQETYLGDWDDFQRFQQPCFFSWEQALRTLLSQAWVW